VVKTIVRRPVNQKVRGMTEKFVLREAVKDVITDTVYRRQKHPFLSPPATLNPEDTFNTYRTANDQILMLLVSICALQERYGLEG
jgi:hypothetical protein